MGREGRLEGEKDRASIALVTRCASSRCWRSPCSCASTPLDRTISLSRFCLSVAFDTFASASRLPSSAIRSSSAVSFVRFCSSVSRSVASSEAYEEASGTDVSRSKERGSLRRAVIRNCTGQPAETPSRHSERPGQGATPHEQFIS